jgi:hypothetical protein
MYVFTIIRAIRMQYVLEDRIRSAGLPVLSVSSVDDTLNFTFDSLLTPQQQAQLEAIIEAFDDAEIQGAINTVWNPVLVTNVLMANPFWTVACGWLYAGTYNSPETKSVKVCCYLDSAPSGSSYSVRVVDAMNGGAILATLGPLTNTTLDFQTMLLSGLPQDQTLMELQVAVVGGGTMRVANAAVGSAQ